jgi:branched-chain amino acid transport system substrate-binding protein
MEMRSGPTMLFASIVSVAALLLAGCGQVPHLARVGEAYDGSAGRAAKACEAGAPGVTQDTIKIGVNATVSGIAAQTGQYARIASDMAVEEINAAGGVRGKKLQLVYEDNQSTNPGAVNALRRSLTHDDVLAVLGPITSTQVNAMLPVIKSEKVPMLVGATNDKLTASSDGMLIRMRPPDSLSAAAIAAFTADDLGAKRIAVLRASDSFGSGAAATVREEAARRGLQVQEETFTSGDTDYTGQLVSLRDGHPDALVLLTTSANDAAIISRQVRELGLTMPTVGSVVYVSAATLKLSGRFGDGIYSVIDFLSDASGRSRAFSAAFTQRAGIPPDLFSAWVYDAMHVMADAIDRAGCDRPDIQRALTQTSGFPGVQGPLSGQPDGDMNSNLYVVQVRDGQPVLVTKSTSGTD